MKSTAIIAAIALLAAVGSTPLIAGDRDHDRRSEREHAVDVRGSGEFTLTPYTSTLLQYDPYRSLEP